MIFAANAGQRLKRNPARKKRNFAPVNAAARGGGSTIISAHKKKKTSASVPIATGLFLIAKAQTVNIVGGLVIWPHDLEVSGHDAGTIQP